MDSARQVRSWDHLVDAVAAWLNELKLGAFDMPRIVAPEPATARLLRQQLASRLPISAGLEFLTPAQWQHHILRDAGLAEQAETWGVPRLHLAIWAAFTQLEPHHPQLARYLAHGGAARRHATALRVARRLRSYLDHAPETLQLWLADHDVDAMGQEIPQHQAWQPDLFRLLVSTTGIDPLVVMDQAEQYLRGAELPTVFCWWQEPRGIVARFSSAVADAHHLHLIASGAPTIEVHTTSSVTRQVEVLRDEVTRHLQEHPDVEPRQALIVTPDPATWNPLVMAACAPAAGHPGRSCRISAATSTRQTNEVLTVLHSILGLVERRATTVEVVQLLTSGPLVHRWGVDRDRLLQLVTQAQVRWGLDERHRAHQGVDGVSQNTWTRGVDRLLAGIALPPSGTALPVAGVDSVSASDLPLLGALAEALSRIRRFHAVDSQPATITSWVRRCLELLNQLFSVPWEDAWMLGAAVDVLDDLARRAEGNTTQLTRTEFTELLGSVLDLGEPRAAVGNGDLHVVESGQLAGVHHRLVAFLGITDALGTRPPDELAMHVPDPRSELLDTLLLHAQSADHVLIVTSDVNPVTGQPAAVPTAVQWLASQLGSPVEHLSHPKTAYAPANFAPSRPSFDPEAFRAAASLQSTAARMDVAATRRRAATTLAVSQAEAAPLSPAALVSFLRDPAREFLRHQMGTRLIEEPELKTQIPIAVAGLDQWELQHRLLESLQTGANRADVELAESTRETLPPAVIGRSVLLDQMSTIGGLWRLARDDYHGHIVDHLVDIGPVVGTVRTRGGLVVAIETSDQLKTLVDPWLHVVALAAAGIPAPARIYQLHKQGYRSVPITVGLQPPSQEFAQAYLTRLAELVIRGRHQLLPLPQEPALRLVDEVVHARFAAENWAAAAGERNGAWRYRSRSWQLFYGDGPADQLFVDQPAAGPTHPYGEFGALAQAVYGPIFQHLGTPKEEQ